MIHSQLVAQNKITANDRVPDASHQIRETNNSEPRRRADAADKPNDPSSKPIGHSKSIRLLSRRSSDRAQRPRFPLAEEAGRFARWLFAVQFLHFHPAISACLS
jgi:hypothetical protein